MVLSYSQHLHLNSSIWTYMKYQAAHIKNQMLKGKYLCIKNPALLKICVCQENRAHILNEFRQSAPLLRGL